MIPGPLQRTLNIQRLQKSLIIIVRRIVMPCPPRAVHKYRARGRDLGVVVDQEGEVGHGLVAAVRWDLEVLCGLVVRGVDIVDADVVAVREGGYPG
jgi:hypothetical protein